MLKFNNILIINFFLYPIQQRSHDSMSIKLIGHKARSSGNESVKGSSVIKVRPNEPRRARTYISPL